MKTLNALIILAGAIVASPVQADSYPFKTLGQIGREQDAERCYRRRHSQGGIGSESLHSPTRRARASCSENS